VKRQDERDPKILLFVCIFFMRGKSLISLPMMVHGVVVLFKIPINIRKKKVVLGGLLTSSAR